MSRGARSLASRTGLLLAGASVSVGCSHAPGSQASTTTGVTTATVTRIPAASDAFPRWAYQWAAGPSGSGVFSVGATPRDGLNAAIPPGRYQVTLAPGATEGTWMRCRSTLCGTAFQHNAIAVGHAAPGAESTVEISASDRAVWVHNVLLSPA